MGQAAGKSKMAGKRSNAAGLEVNEDGEQYGMEQDVPNDILWEILIRVPGKDLVTSCVLVCKQWYDVIESKTFWKHMCVTEHNYSRELTHYLANEDFKKLYFSNPYQINLIRNSCGEMGNKHWTIKSNGGDGWKTENPTGCDPLVEYTHDIQTKDVMCWVTSYGLCAKEQTIDLIERGCSEYILDEVRPDICISEWYAGRFDCGMRYTLAVELLNTKTKKTKMDWSHGTTEPAAMAWYKVEHRFSNYEPGVRCIRYRHTGMDTQFWAGWYGAKMTLSTVVLDFTQLEKRGERLDAPE